MRADALNGSRVAAFVTGLLLCYGVLALTASLIGTLVAFSQLIYLGLSGAFLCFGLRALAFDKGCLHQHERNRSGVQLCSPAVHSVLVVSPCCTPVVATIAGVTSLSGSPLASFSVAIAFAMGHIAPLASLGLGLRWVARIAEDPTLQNASGVIGGGIIARPRRLLWTFSMMAWKTSLRRLALVAIALLGACPILRPAISSSRW